jgi:hypothetical protein
MDPITTILDASRENGRGVTLHLPSGTVSLVVTSFDDAFVLGRSQASSSIAVRRDMIQAAVALF